MAIPVTIVVFLGGFQFRFCLDDARSLFANRLCLHVELRRMQMVTEVGAENNSTTVLMIPSDFVSLAKGLSEYLRERTSNEG